MPPTDRAAVDEADLQAAEKLTHIYQKLNTQLSRVIVGQRDVLKEVMIALFCQGHCILEGVPGLAKTLMIASIAQLLSLNFKRIQFTPDLMPSDITGTEILEEEEGAAGA
jgi:MoxR-like ATPase